MRADRFKCREAGAVSADQMARHCERSEAIQSVSTEAGWIASSQELLAMTADERYTISVVERVWYACC
jgi:hypothetical protein